MTIANIETADQARHHCRNERVLRARLSDGRFFWDQDRKTSLEARLPALEKIVFHAGSARWRKKPRGWKNWPLS